MIAVYNIIAAVWSLLTVYSGVKYAEGYTEGPLSAYASVFDYLFGLDLTPLIPASNQSPPYLKPANECSTPFPYPHGGDKNFSINKSITDGNGTAVQGCGGVTSKRLQRGSKLVPTIQYIAQRLTGTTTGNIASGAYSRSVFKQGTPYYTTVNQDASQPAANTIGYYFTKDTNGKEVPLISPCINQYNFPGNLFAYNPNGRLPDDWNAVITTGAGQQTTCYSGISPYKPGTNQSTQWYYLNSNGHYDYNPKTKGYDYIKSQPFNNIQGFGNEASNEYFIQTSLQDSQVYYKEFPKNSSFSPTDGTAQWERQKLP